MPPLMRQFARREQMTPSHAEPDVALIDKTIDEFVAPGLLFHAPVPFGATGPQALKKL